MHQLYLQHSFLNGRQKKDIGFALCIIAAVLLRVASDATAATSYMTVAAYALLGRKQAIQALAISWLLTMLNTGFASESAGLSASRYLVIFTAALSATFRSIKRSNLNIGRLSINALMLGAFILLHSIFFSEVPDVSILKVTAWIIVVVTLHSSWQGLNNDEKLSVFNQIKLLLLWIVILSVPLLAVPAIGYLKNGEGFQGVMNHPQSFGPTVALLGALVGGAILSQSKPRWRDILIFILCLVMTVLSGARTAGLALIFGLACAVFFCPTFAGLPRTQVMPALKSRRFQVAALIALIVVILSGPFLANQISAYLFKQSDASTLLDAAEASRGQLVQNMFSNIAKQPFTGIGFGIASNSSEMEVERDAVLGLPLSAIVEKGVMPVAVVEELGIFGGLAVLIWVIAILRRGARIGVQQFAVLITLLTVNFGESMLFSTGGMGLLLLILLSGATAEENR